MSSEKLRSTIHDIFSKTNESVDAKVEQLKENRNVTKGRHNICKQENRDWYY